MVSLAKADIVNGCFVCTCTSSVQRDDVGMCRTPWLAIDMLAWFMKFKFAEALIEPPLVACFGLVCCLVALM